MILDLIRLRELQRNHSRESSRVQRHMLSRVRSLISSI